MSRTPSQPIEITVKANIAHPFAELSWQFVRLGVMHRFKAIVMQNDKDGNLSFKHDSFTLLYPISHKQREEFRAKYPNDTVPITHEKQIPINAPSYKDMILSIRALLKVKPLIDDARTCTTGTVHVRYPEFIYPTWYRRKDPSVYDPNLLIRTEIAPSLPSTVRNGLDVPAQPAYFMTPPAPPLLALIEKFTPLAPPPTHEGGIRDALSVLNTMREELADAMAAQTSAGKTMLTGYIAILDEAVSRIGKLAS